MDEMNFKDNKISDQNGNRDVDSLKQDLKGT